MEPVFIGNHPSIQRIRELINAVKDTFFNVLILGESGTGKEVVARLLHRSSSRRNRKFVKVNCAALPKTLLESELFGYEKGAFTGAFRAKPGKFEIASEGVVFLDEIGDMPPALQAKLLQVLQSGEFNRLGGVENIKVNAWVIASTNHDLNKDMSEGLFRKDLFYRLNIIAIELPSLAERWEDIPLLADYFIQKFKRTLNIREQFTVKGDLMDVFKSYHWPGNVREFSNVILRLVVGEDPGSIRSELLRGIEEQDRGLLKGFQTSKSGPAGLHHPVDPLKKIRSEATRYIERKAILHALGMTGWNKRKASRLLKISYKALFDKIAYLEINPKSSRRNMYEQA